MSMGSNTKHRVLGTITSLGIVAFSACQTGLPSPDEAEPPIEAMRVVEGLRAAFQLPSPALEQPRVAAIGDSIATGYEWVGQSLRMIDTAASAVDFTLPARADGARRFTSGGVSIAAHLQAGPANAEVAGGYVVYRGALGDRTSVIEQIRPDGVEDFFYFPERPASEHIAFGLDLEAGVGGLRLVANTLEVLDAAGLPRLRVNPPVAIGGDGAVVAAQLDVRGCAVDTNPAIPSRVRTPPGARSCEIHLAWKGVTYPALVDPTWVATSNMAFVRAFPASSLVIDDHHVLVTGGLDVATGALASTEIWDASTGVWTVTGNLKDRRYDHQQVLLASGKVLVTGGLDVATPIIASSEEYDPTTGTWGNWTTMASARYDFPLVVVAGVPVVIGGGSPTGALAACEKYNTATHTWSAFAAMATKRRGAAAVNSGPNAFLVSGGMNSSGWLDSSELYSTGAGAFWAGATMLHKRAFHQGNPVSGNSRVLVTGGSDGIGYLKTAETYFGNFVFPQPGSWSAVADMSLPRIRHQTVNLSPGRVMACGGLQTPAGVNTKTCETFDTLTFAWTPDCDMTTPRDAFTMLIVPSLAKALGAGGRSLLSAELSCHHDKCTNGIPLVSGSSPCVTQVCTADPFCCTAAWNGLCIQEVRTVCGSLTCVESAGTCTHPLCTAGPALVNFCDAAKANCVMSICAADPFCCTTAWDGICVSRVASLCGKNCN